MCAVRILALETSAKAASAAVTEDGKLLCFDYQDTGLTHSRTLMPMAEHLLRTAGFRPADMDAFAAAAGPGSFTGIRIGAAAVKGLAFGADRPAVGVSTLAAMARNVTFAGGLIVCAMDARRSQIYNALFAVRDGAAVRLTEDRAVSLDALAAELSGGGPVESAGSPAELSGGNPADAAARVREERTAARYSRVTVVGDGAALCAAFLNAHGVPCRTAPPQVVMQNAASVAFEAEALAKAGLLSDAQSLRPVYLRPPSALTLKQRGV